MITVSSLANKADVTADTVRHYVKLGLLRPDRLSGNGYKVFSKSDISRVQFIRNAKSLGFTLKEILEMFAMSKDGNSPCPQVRDALQKHIEENRAKLNEMQAMQARMEKALSQWSDMPDCIPDEASVCHLIESVAQSKLG